MLIADPEASLRFSLLNLLFVLCKFPSGPSLRMSCAYSVVPQLLWRLSLRGPTMMTSASDVLDPILKSRQRDLSQKRHSINGSSNEKSLVQVQLKSEVGHSSSVTLLHQRQQPHRWPSIIQLNFIDVTWWPPTPLTSLHHLPEPHVWLTSPTPWMSLYHLPQSSWHHSITSTSLTSLHHYPKPHWHHSTIASQLPDVTPAGLLNSDITTPGSWVTSLPGRPFLDVSLDPKILISFSRRDNHACLILPLDDSSLCPFLCPLPLLFSLSLSFCSLLLIVSPSFSSFVSFYALIYFRVFFSLSLSLMLLFNYIYYFNLSIFFSFIFSLFYVYFTFVFNAYIFSIFFICLA